MCISFTTVIIADLVFLLLSFHTTRHNCFMLECVVAYGCINRTKAFARHREGTSKASTRYTVRASAVQSFHNLQIRFYDRIESFRARVRLPSPPSPHLPAPPIVPHCKTQIACARRDVDVIIKIEIDKLQNMWYTGLMRAALVMCSKPGVF